MTWWSTNTPSPSCDLCNLEVQPPENVQKFRKERIIFHDFWKLKKIRGCFLESGNFWDVKITQRSFYFGILEKKLHHFVYHFLQAFAMSGQKIDHIDLFQAGSLTIFMPPNQPTKQHQPNNQSNPNRIPPPQGWDPSNSSSLDLLQISAKLP